MSFLTLKLEDMLQAIVLLHRRIHKPIVVPVPILTTFTFCVVLCDFMIQFFWFIRFSNFQ